MVSVTMEEIRRWMEEIRRWMEEIRRWMEEMRRWMEEMRQVWRSDKLGARFRAQKEIDSRIDPTT